MIPNWLSIVLALGGSTLCGLIVTGIWNFLNKKALKNRELQEKDKTDELIKTITDIKFERIQNKIVAGNQ